jgi:hypothetical protein
LTLDPMTLDEVIASILTTGLATGTEPAAQTLVSSLRTRVHDLVLRLADSRRRSTLVLEWTDPAFTAGHWVPDLVTVAGGEPVLGHAGARSVGVDWDVIGSCAAEVVIVAPCGYRLDGASRTRRPGVARRPTPRGRRGVGGRRRRRRGAARTAGRGGRRGVRHRPAPGTLRRAFGGGRSASALTTASHPKRASIGRVDLWC